VTIWPTLSRGEMHLNIGRKKTLYFKHLFSFYKISNIAILVCSLRHMRVPIRLVQRLAINVTATSLPCTSV
jgi:hypothetical protein